MNTACKKRPQSTKKENIISADAAEINAQLMQRIAVLEQTIANMSIGTEIAKPLTVAIPSAPVGGSDTAPPPQILIGFDRTNCYQYSAEFITSLFLDNADLKHYSEISNTSNGMSSMLDPKLTLSYIVTIFNHLMLAMFEDPALRNIYLNPGMMNQVVVYTDAGKWIFIPLVDALKTIYNKLAIFLTQLVYDINRNKNIPLEILNTLGIVRNVYGICSDKVLVHGKGAFMCMLQTYPLPGKRLPPPEAVVAPVMLVSQVIKPLNMTIFENPQHPMYKHKPHVMSYPSPSDLRLDSSDISSAIAAADDSWTPERIYHTIYALMQSHPYVPQSEIFAHIDRKLGETISEDPPSLTVEACAAAKAAKSAYETSSAPIIKYCIDCE